MEKESTKYWILQGIVSLLILLWVYAALSKLTDIDQFTREIKQQHLPLLASRTAIWLLPAIELIAASLLISPKWRRTGLILSSILMLIFTFYILLVLSGYFKNIPCSCGGVLKQLGWRNHLIFNIFFLVLGIIGIHLSIGKEDAVTAIK